MELLRTFLIRLIDINSLIENLSQGQRFDYACRLEKNLSFMKRTVKESDCNSKHSKSVKYHYAIST